MTASRHTACLLSTLSLAGAFVAMLCTPAPVLAQGNPRIRAQPRVHILATGGTIAGEKRNDGTGGYDAAKLSVDVMIAANPKLGSVARITGEQVSQIASQDMNDQVWLALAKAANAALSKPDVAGIVITHGTDTLEETAFFLDHVLRTKKPVVLVGSMRPPQSDSPDGSANLLQAVRLAASREAQNRGVLVVFNDTIHHACDVTKSHTTRVDTFHSPNQGPIGHFYNDKPVFFSRSEPEAPFFDIARLDRLPRVEIVYAHANMTPLMIDAAISANVAGIVVAGTGNGNLSAAGIEALDRARKQNIVVVRSTRTGSGRVERNVELNDDAKGYIAAGFLNPQKARILLMLALTRTKDLGQIQQLFFAR